MVAKIDIYNGALAHCGEPSITSLNQDNKGARLLNREYDKVRMSTLGRYRWNFAKKRASVAADPDAPAFGFNFRYRRPNDLLYLIGLGDERETQRNYTSSDQIYKMEGDFILTDQQAPLQIAYIENVTETGRFDPHFVTVFEYFLATQIFYALTKGTDRYQALVRERVNAIKEAKFAHAIENTPEIVMASDWLDARFQDGGFYGSNFRIGPVL
ncbi:MAG: hypothetical protein AB7U76_24480 [Pirellulales bacterium]